MEKIRVYYDQEGRTLTVWFDEPKKEHHCEETGEEIILIKDVNGRVIGFERLNVNLESKDAVFAIEAIAI